MFRGRNLLITTRHRKETVIAKLLERALGVKCVVAENLDTDASGTITSEIERRDNPTTMLPTKEFAKAGFDNVTSVTCKHQQRFGLEV